MQGYLLSEIETDRRALFATSRGFKVHIFWEGHKILRYLHLTFDCMYCSQKRGGDFAKFCGLLRIYELYEQKIALCRFWLTKFRQRSDKLFKSKKKLKSMGLDLLFTNTSFCYAVKAKPRLSSDNKINLTKIESTCLSFLSLHFPGLFGRANADFFHNTIMADQITFL